NLAALENSGTECLRCKTPMKNAGEVSIHEGTSSVFGIRLVKFDQLDLAAEICPNCGKLEFYV
ncbi:MAG: hypothetical protein AAGG01_03765, partial [Planctomycetota bacterium]